jgi:hypothetical protein
MTSLHEVQFRAATAADIAAMAQSRLTDPTAGPADPRMAAYFNGEHHPQQALLPRVGFVAVAADAVVGYVAGHLTTRCGYAGEVQYLFVAPAIGAGGLPRRCFDCWQVGFRNEPR